MLRASLAQKLGREGPLGEVYRWLGAIHRESGASAEAERVLQDARSIARDQGNPLLEAEAERELAGLFRDQARNREALESLLASRRIYNQLQAKRDLAELGRRLKQIESQFLGVVQAWAESIEAKDRYTHGHCGRVADLATTLARRLGFEEATLMWFRMGAFLHDVGKIETPTGILNKPGRLTEAETEVIKRHTVAGDSIVAALDFPWDIRPMVRSHHERWDGNGYPDGLRGREIPLPARILCVADVFDALTSDRPYRGALSRDQAMAIMARGSGSQFDPEVFATFTDFSRESGQTSLTYPTTITAFLSVNPDRRSFRQSPSELVFPAYGYNRFSDQRSAGFPLSPNGRASFNSMAQ